MNENLSQMVKEIPADDAVVFSETDLDLPTEESVVGETEHSQVEVDTITIVSLSTWFEQNCERLTNINQVKMVVRGVNTAKSLIMAVKCVPEETDEKGDVKRDLRIFENPDIQPVLNIPGLSMDIYNNNIYRIIYEYDHNIFIKCYGVRTGSIVVFCNNIDGKLIPYGTTRVKKKDTEIEVVAYSPAEVSAKLLADADLESLQLRYKQSAKAIDSFRTNQDVVDWLLERQSEITDINHHLQIDGIIIDMLV